MDSVLKSHFVEFKEIVSSALNKEDSRKFLADLEQLKDKSRSDNFNIAVIGEFNSGKSTFINALLRERILKEAGRPTTATATYISRSKPHTLRQFFFGTKTYVSLAFDDGNSFVINEKDFQNCSAYLSKTYYCSTENIYDIIQAVTSEQQISKHVVGLHIELPFKGLPKNVTVIDTPGFNPGETNFENHLRITEEVVARVADVAIVLMPSNSAMSATLVNFIESNIYRYLHRCIFIITKIDLIPEYEREAVVGFVRNQLNQIGVSNPIVYALSAMTVLPVKKIPASMAESWPIFQKEFSQTELKIWKNLERYKSIALREHIYYLFEDLSVELESQLRNVQSLLEEALVFLKNNNIKKIETLTDSANASATLALDRFYSHSPTSTTSYIDSVIHDCSTIIRAGGKLRNYKKVEGPKVNNTIVGAANRYLKTINAHLDGSKKIVSQEVEKFRSEFHSHYKDIPSLEPKMNYLPQSGSLQLDTIDLSTCDSLWNENIVYSSFRNIINIFRNERNIQDDVINDITPEIKNYFHSLETRASKFLNSTKDSQKKSLKGYCDSHIRQYSKVVRKLIDEQKHEKDRLENSICFIQGKIINIKSLHGKMSTEIEQMKKYK